jgi:hypothetical protein
MLPWARRPAGSQTSATLKSERAEHRDETLTLGAKLRGGGGQLGRTCLGQGEVANPRVPAGNASGKQTGILGAAG